MKSLKLNEPTPTPDPSPIKREGLSPRIFSLTAAVGKGRGWGVLIAVFLVLTLALVIPAYAQGGSGKKVTDDEVNNVARKLYCPVCENIPLDTCGTQACAQWRDEIRTQLESGVTPEQVINNFVTRFGDRVVGTPQNPTLRALSLVTPWILSAVALAVAGFAFYRWRKNQALAVEDDLPAVELPNANEVNTAVDDYRLRLERDLAARR